jgi:hypothetical protein
MPIPASGIRRKSSRKSFRHFSTGSSRLPELLAQGLHRLVFATNPKESAVLVGTLLKHFTTGKDCSALLLGRPGQENFGLDQTFPEEAYNHFAQQGHVIGASCAHDDAIGILVA